MTLPDAGSFIMCAESADGLLYHRGVRFSGKGACQLNCRGGQHFADERDDVPLLALCRAPTTSTRMQTLSFIKKGGSGICAAAERPSWEEGISSDFVTPTTDRP
jgi:hypothetical protein